MNTRKNCGFVLRYSIGYLVIAALMLCVCLALKCSMVFSNDGLHQHFPLLIHLRRQLISLLSGNGFDMVNFQVGQGLDTIVTLASHAFLDPLNLLVLLVPERLLEIAYNLYILANYYLMGLCFCFYLRRLSFFRDAENRWIIPLGGLMYSFTGFNGLAAIQHPYFACGGLYLAIMLLCAERVLSERKWFGFSLTAGIMLIANYYFAYMVTLLTVLYIILRLAFLWKREGMRACVRPGFTMLGAYIGGAALSAVFFVPIVTALAGNGRVGNMIGLTGSLLFYDAEYYRIFFHTLVVPCTAAGSWTRQNLIPLVIPALMLLVTPKKRTSEAADGIAQLRIALIACVVMLLIPFFGHVFNGFSYVTNRWCFGYEFAVYAACACCLPELVHADRKRLRACGLFTLAYALVLCFQAYLFRNHSDGSPTALNLCILAGCAAVLCTAGMLLVLHRLNAEKRRRLLTAALAGFVLCYALAGAVGLAVTGMHRLDIYRQLLNSPGAGMRSVEDDDGFYRVNTYYTGDHQNTAIGYHGTSCYWSVIPAFMTEYYRNLEHPHMRFSFRIDGMQGDSVLNELSAVHYTAGTPGTDLILPYGYEPVAGAEEVYRNAYAVPAAYVFRKEMSEAAYMQLNPVDKRYALLTHAVTEQPQTDEAVFESAVVPLNWELVSTENAEFSGNRMTFGQDGSITLRFDAPADSRIYLRFVRPEFACDQDSLYADVMVQTVNGKSAITFVDPNSTLGYEQLGAVLELGAFESGSAEAAITGPVGNIYTFADCELYAVPEQRYVEGVQQLQAELPETLVFGQNRIDCTLETAGGVLQFSVPYGKGWTALVDGKPAELIRCGGMYMGLRLEPGAHEIALTYCTPGLKTGACISASALFLLLVLRFLPRRKNH